MNKSLCHFFILFFLFLVTCSRAPTVSLDPATVSYLKNFSSEALSAKVVSPRGFTGPDLPEVVVRFSQPMVTLTQVFGSARPELVQMDPPVKGVVFWPDPRTFVFKFSQPLTVDQKYTVTIKSMQESLLGRALVRDQEFDFTVRQGLSSATPRHDFFPEAGKEVGSPLQKNSISVPDDPKKHTLNVTLGNIKDGLSPDESFELSGEVRGGQKPYWVAAKIFRDVDEARRWLAERVMRSGTDADTKVVQDMFKLSLNAPHEPGPYSLVVVSRNPDGHWGMALFQIKVEAPFQLDFLFPERVRVGDVVRMPVHIHNLSDVSQACRLESVAPQVSVTRDGSDQIQLNPRQKTQVTLEILVHEALTNLPSETGFEGEIELSCAGENFTTRQQQKFYVSSPHVILHEKYLGVLEERKNLSVIQKADWKNDVGGVYLFFSSNPDTVESRYGKSDVRWRGGVQEAKARINLNEQEIFDVELGPWQDHDDIFLPMQKLPQKMDFEFVRQRMDKSRQKTGWLFYMMDVAYTNREIPGGIENGAVVSWQWMPDPANQDKFSKNLVKVARLHFYLDRGVDKLRIELPQFAGARLEKITAPWSLKPASPSVFIADKTAPALVLDRVLEGYHMVDLVFRPLYFGKYISSPLLLKRVRDGEILAQIHVPALDLP